MFQTADAVLIRAASYPRDLTLPAWPDLTASQPEVWLKWLDQAWALPGFAAAITTATPQLTAQITRALAGVPCTEHRLRRLTEAVVRYLLRWTTRANPFGLFAGAAPAHLGLHASVVWGEQHHAAARPDDLFIAEHASIAEQNPATLRAVTVMTNTLGFRRGGKWVLPCARVEDGRVQDAEADLTGPVRLAVETASSPVMFTELAAKIAAEYPADQGAAEQLLAALVRERILLSAIRPPMTVTDPAAHLARHVNLPDPGDRSAVDLRLDCAVTLPPAVTREACAAASALAAVAPAMPGWTAYHAAFIERWGPGAAVPLREVLRVLGFPARYLGASRRGQAAFTARDALLAELAQRSALDSCAEVILDDDLIGRLRGDDDRPPIPHTELRFTLAAQTVRDLDRGAFMLTVVSGARHAGVAAGRFLHLLTPAELDRFRSVYASLPTSMPGADIVQISAPPLQARLTALARTPELLPVLPIGDFHPNPPRSLTDLAVAGDGRRLWLTSLTTGCPVEPLLLNAVLLPALQHPVVRFLTEIWTAWTAPCARFDWGHAQGLPFLPCLRRGRSILHPARWTITQQALPGRVATWGQWHAAWQRLRDQRQVPREVLLGDGDERLRLDLDEKAHMALLRSDLDRHGHTILTQADGPADWIDGRPAEILLTLANSPQLQPTPRPARTASLLCHRPGQSQWIEARLHGRCDDMLTRLASPDPGPPGRAGWELPDGWWFVRYPDPEPHLRLRIPLRDPSHFAAAAHGLAMWADQLHEDGLLHDCSLHPYRPATRHGTGPVLAAAEQVFAADSRAAIRALAQPHTDRQATTAAGMITIAAAFTGDGMTWLATHAPRNSGPRLDAHQLTLARTHYGDDQLSAALGVYRTLVEREGLNADHVLGDLLHLHHARMIGVDTDSERHCLRLARAIALADLARRTS